MWPPITRVSIHSMSPSSPGSLSILPFGASQIEQTAAEIITRQSRVPVLILSVRNREQDKIGAFDHGADDYVTKPFNTGELLARLSDAARKLRHLQRKLLCGVSSILVKLLQCFKGRPIQTF